MKAKDPTRVSVLRGLLAGFVNENVAKGRKPEETIPDEDALAVIKRQARQRQDSIEQFTKGGRQDLAEKETNELNILKTYLPAEMSEAEIRKVVEAKKAELGINDLPAQAGKSKIGQLIGAVMKELKGQADGAVVKKVVESLFS